MNVIAFLIFAMGAALALAILSVVYQLVGSSWQSKPIRPLLMGLFLISFGFSWHLYLNILSADTKNSIDHFANEPASQSLKKELAHDIDPDILSFSQSSVLAYDATAKLIELFIIPLGVSIVAAAIVLKADLNFGRRRKSFKAAMKELESLENELNQSESEFDLRLTNFDRGHDIVDEHKRLINFRMSVFRERQEIRKKFDDFL